MSDPAHSAGGSEATSSSLLQRVKARDQEAWQRLVGLYGPLVYRWCRQSGLQADDTVDVFQEVFGAVASSVADFRRDRPGDSFRKWLATITRNKIRDLFRRLQNEPQGLGGTDAQRWLGQIPDELSDSSETPGPSPTDGGVERRAMELVRASVEEHTWQAFWRVTVAGEKVADVAEDLGMNARAVYEAKYRVMRKIRAELADLID